MDPLTGTTQNLSLRHATDHALAPRRRDAGDDPGPGGHGQYLGAATASDRIYDALASTQGRRGDAPPNRLGPHDRRQQAEIVRRWKQNRRAALSVTVARKIRHTRDLRGQNQALNLRFMSTNQALASFNKAAHSATLRPEYFQSALSGLANNARAYGDLVGRQVAMAREMHALDHQIDTAGGERPMVFDAGDVQVSGPLSADVDNPHAERMVGSGEMARTRADIANAMSMMRQSLNAMKRGERLVDEMDTLDGNENMGASVDYLQKDVTGNSELHPHARRPVHVQHAAIDQLENRLQGLQTDSSLLG